MDRSATASPAQGMGPTERELFHICGDVPDPSGRSGAEGFQSTLDLSKTKHGEPKIRYQDRSGQTFILTADVYKYEGAPLEVHILCPRCSTEAKPHALRITSDQKAISYEKGVMTDRGGRLNMERIECTWEIDGTKAVGIVGSSLNLCRWKVVIENNVARDV